MLLTAAFGQERPGAGPLGQGEVAGQAASDSAAANSAAPPPVVITVDEAGNLILQSNDPAALDRLEEIMRNNRPPRRAYDVFNIKYARASWVKLNLDEYFEDESQDDGNDRLRFFFGFDDNQKKDEARQLGTKNPLRFIADNDTNSIVVIGADDLDRQTIKELIKLWDVPEPESDLDLARYTELVKVQYSRADSIASALKEAYRDLLSANDKAFQEGDEESKRGSGGGGVQAGGGMSFSFKGKLSLGVDSVTNSILVSAEGRPLLEIIVKMIHELDDAAQREGAMEVYALSPGMSGKSVKEALERLLAPPKPQPNQQNAQQQQAQEQQQQQAEQQAQDNQRRGRRDRDR